ncbi:uncharacterized protein LOC131164139 [Malania oleifera]|uniref:uncharacterized protein LOC131164139 n=1 Tax=Malania oleifera TaxID=397392 RepID=UPI0025AEA157|nr:uncharacterized protein LOC131164139 [Malania oleifera]XP_057977107.1 uncharacterized protein LOC131164139 [Malania oleifera]
MAKCSISAFSDSMNGLKIHYDRSTQTFDAHDNTMSDLRGDNLFNCQKGKMFMQGNFELNPVQRYADSLNVLKQTMLKQEIIFRKQVYELHRLYSIQKTLMDDLDSTTFDRFNLSKASKISSSMGFTNLTKNKVLPQAAYKDLLKEHQGTFSDLPHGHLNLQLPADQYISHVVIDLPNKEDVCNQSKELPEVERSLVGEFVDLEEVELTLSVGEHTSSKGCRNRSANNKETYSCPEVIDLEESLGRESLDDAKTSSALSFAAPMNYSRHSQVYVPSNSVVLRSGKNDLAPGIAMSGSIVDRRGSYWEPISIDRDTGSDVLQQNLFTNRQQVPTCKAREIDLNGVQFDDLSCCSKGPMVAYPSTASSSGSFHALLGKFHDSSPNAATCWKKPSDECSNKTSNMFRQGDVMDLSLMDNCTDDNSKEIQARNLEENSRNEVVYIDLESAPSPPVDLCEGIGSHNGNSRGLSPEHQDDLSRDRNHANVATAYSTCEKSEEQDTISCPHPSQIKVQDGCCNQSPASLKSDCLTDSSSGVKTAQYGTQMGSSNLYAFNKLAKLKLESQISGTNLSEPDLRSSDGSKSSHQHNDKDAEEPAEVDVLIQRAAEALLHISLGGSAGHQDCSSEAGLHEMEIVKGRREYSSDSFESITLGLKESSLEDYSVSSKLFEVNETEDFGFKLRRGRRLKDFRKDILPTLASLSRHEICEDINIFEGVIRSREYRKMRSKMGNGDNWCMPVRSRRSRVSCVRRRN